MCAALWDVNISCPYEAIYARHENVKFPSLGQSSQQQRAYTQMLV